MRVITNLEADTYDQIEEIIADEGYKSVDQFIRVAIQNQISIETTESDGGEKDSETSQHDVAVWGKDIPSNPPLNSPFEMNREEILLFQQYYRFFPLIFVMKELAIVTDEEDGPVKLSRFRNYMKNAVEPIRDSIYEWEQKNDIKKSYRKSTGLPKLDVKNPEYSMKRFLDHYVGKVRHRDDQPQAFGNSLGLVSYAPIDNHECLVQLTPDGNELIQNENPLITNGPENPSLSESEREFLISHIGEKLPEERRFATCIFETLEDCNQETYTNHLDVFREFLISSSGFPDEDPSEERVRSHTAGALSRLVELGILSRGSRRGVYLPERHPGNI